MSSNWLPFFEKTLRCQAHGCRLNSCIFPDAQCIVTSDFMPCPDGDNTIFIVSAELRNPDGFAPVHAWFVVPGLFADRGWESYYPFLIPQALPLFPLGVYCVYLKSVNRDAFPFIAVVDDLLREQHSKDTTPSDVHQMTQALTNTDTNLEACATPLYHNQTSESISTRTSPFFSLLPPATKSIHNHNFNSTPNAIDLDKIPDEQISDTSIEHIDLSLPPQPISTMSTTMQAVRPGQQATVATPNTWAGVAAGSCQSSVEPPKVEAPATVGASVDTNAAVPFQRQLNGNQLRKAKRQQKSGAEAHADKRHQSTSPVEDQPSTSSTGRGCAPDKPLPPRGTCMPGRKEMPVEKGLNAHWPALSRSKPPINNSERTTATKLPGTVGYETLTEHSAPQAPAQIEQEMPQSSAQASLPVDTGPPQSSVQNLEQVDPEPVQIDSANVKPKTKGQKKNERRRNAKLAKKLKDEEEEAALASATASALAGSIAQPASTGEADIEQKPETIIQTNQLKGPATNKSRKPADIISKSALVAKPNPPVKPVPIESKSPPAFGSIPSSTFEPVLQEQPQELKWDVPHEETPSSAFHFQLPAFAGSNNILPTDNTEQEIREPLIESMSTAPTSHPGLFTIPSELKDCNQSVPKQGLFNFSSPSINIGSPVAKEGECTGSNIPTPNQDLASLIPELESFNLFDQPLDSSSIDTAGVPREDIPAMIREHISKVTPEDEPVMAGEVLSGKVPALDAALGPEVILQDPFEDSPAVASEMLLEGTEDLFGHTMQSEAPQFSSDFDPTQSYMIQVNDWREDLYFSDVAEWMFYGYEPETRVGDAGPSDMIQLRACHKESDVIYDFYWEIPHLWGEPKPLHLQEFPTPSHFVEFGREISEIFDDSGASDAGTEAETSPITVEVDDANDDNSFIIENSLTMAKGLQSENDISDAINDVPQPPSAESPPAKDHHHMDNSMPAVPQSYNIRENVYFFLPPEEDMTDTIGNTDESQLSMAESRCFLVEDHHDMADATPVVPQEYNIRDNVYFFLPPEDDVSDAIENPDHSQITIAESGSSLVDENPNPNDAEPFVPHVYNIRENVLFFLPPEDDVPDAIRETDAVPSVPQEPNVQENALLAEEDFNILSEKAEVSSTVMKSDSDHSIDDACSERGPNNSLDGELSPVSRDLSLPENVLPEEGYDIMKNVYFFMSKEVDVPNTAMRSGSENLVNGSSSEREACHEESHNIDRALPRASQDSKTQENEILPEEDYDIMRNGFSLIPREVNVSSRVIGSNSDLNDNAKSELASCETDNPTGGSVESPDDSHNESISRSGTVVIGPNDVEGQEQLRRAIWASLNAPTKSSHSHNISSSTTGTSSSVNGLNSVPSVTSVGTAEGHIDVTESYTDTEAVQAHSENIALSAPVEISYEGSSQQKEETSNRVYNFGSTTVWAGKKGFEVGKAAATVMLIPADLAVQATIMSSFRITKTSFLIGRWACARFGPRWLGRFVGA